jgi:ubiquinol-cytochrome c reductase cytochrome b subunit
MAKMNLEKLRKQSPKEKKTLNGQIGSVSEWLDDRLGLAKGGRVFFNKIFPDHWSFMLGEIALYSFVVLLVTGVFLSLYYVPSGALEIYHGTYAPLRGTVVSAAYSSTVNLSLHVRFGLLVRQMHHWAADIFLGAIAVHMCRIFFTGAFRKPRELNWIIGVTLLILGIVEGYLGYSLPDDLISGTGLRLMFSVTESIPIVGTHLAFWIFGGNYPGNGSIIPRMFIAHVLLIPAIITALIVAHLGLLVKQKHTQFPGPGRTEKNVVGTPMWPGFMFKTQGFMFLVVGVIALLGAFAQINPIWLYGQYLPYKVSYAVQPDWYMGWLDGALRIMPSWEFQYHSIMIPNQFFPAVLLPGIVFNIFILWPFIEAKITKDKKEHHLLERPRDNPMRTAIGAGTFTFLFMLFSASATDVLANYLTISLNIVLWFFRIATYIIPFIVAAIAYRFCIELQRAGDKAGKRKRTNIVWRNEQGEYYIEKSPAREGDFDVIGETEEEPIELTPELSEELNKKADLIGVGSSAATNELAEKFLESGEDGVKHVSRD